jgi:hypothetical protein
MSIPPVTPSNQSIFNISKIETNELNRGFDMRDEEEIANANEDSGFRLTRTPENIKHREGALLIQIILWIIHKIEMKQDSIIEMVKRLQIPDEFIRKKSIHLRRNG